MATDETTTNETADQSPAAALWRIAVSNYEAAVAEEQRLTADHDEALAAYKAEVGEDNPDFERYGLWTLYPRDRDEFVRFAAIQIATVDHAGSMKALSGDDYEALAKKAAQIIDDHEAHRQRKEEAWDRLVDSTEKVWEAALDRLCHARDKLLETPAPDADAMTMKLDILAALMTESCDQDADAVCAIRDDAHRLFGSK